jgi:putative ABC transport system ATP-binding protein
LLKEARDPILLLDKVSKSYGEAPLRTDVLSAISFSLYREEITSLTGVSGSGKSTLISLIAGLMLPDSGTILFEDQDITVLDDEERARLRSSRIGVVLQSGNLIPFLTALENVDMAFAISGKRRSTARARQLLSELGLRDRLDHLPQWMSGGEMQRVSVAVALANEPDLLLADEVTGELDSSSSEQVVDVLIGTCRDRKQAMLLVTHDHAVAARAQHQLRLVDGRLCSREIPPRH